MEFCCQLAISSHLRSAYWYFVLPRWCVPPSRNAYVSAAAFQCCCSSSSTSPCSQRCPAICCCRRFRRATERSSCGASSAVWCYCLVDSYCCYLDFNGDDLGVPIHLEIFILIHFLNMYYDCKYMIIYVNVFVWKQLK